MTAFVVGSVFRTFTPEPYDTLAAAEARIGEIEKMDPRGVELGHYYIDGPEPVTERTLTGTGAGW